MATKHMNVSIKTIGLSVSCILAVIYALVMFAGLLIVGLGSTGSWQAAFLGIGWGTAAGFELGLLGMVIVGFAVALAFVPAYNFLRRRVPGRSKTQEQMSPSNRPSAHSRAFRLLTALLVLLPLPLLVLHLLASAMPFSVKKGVDTVSIMSSGGQTQAMNMGSIINTVYREAEPSFTADGRTMYFNCNNSDICVSHRSGTWEQGNWSTPERLGAPINTEYEEVEPVINPAGDQLYFNSNRPEGVLKGIPFLSPWMNVFEVANTIAQTKSGVSLLNGLGMGHVWVSDKINGVWSEPHKLGDIQSEPPVNSAFHDHCLAISADGNEVFWTSTRPGGYGGNDIWTSRRVNGQWTKAENLGPKVNGSKDEHHSMPTPDGKRLYVTSNRPGGYGGEDIYVSTRGTDGKWGPLVNLGPQVNGSGDDRCLVWTPDLRIFLFDSEKQPGFGSRDIWWIYSKTTTEVRSTKLSTQVPTPSADTALQEGPALLQTRCTECHSLQKVQQAKKTRAEWEQTVLMMKIFGAKISDPEEKVLLDYLTNVNRP